MRKNNIFEGIKLTSGFIGSTFVGATIGIGVGTIIKTTSNPIVKVGLWTAGVICGGISGEAVGNFIYDGLDSIETKLFTSEEDDEELYLNVKHNKGEKEA